MYLQVGMNLINCWQTTDPGVLYYDSNDSMELYYDSQGSYNENCIQKFLAKKKTHKLKEHVIYQDLFI